MTKFSDKIIYIVKQIPKGKVASYGQIALLADSPRAARQVGWILHAKGDAPGVPWWRVVNNKGVISIKNTEISSQLQKKLLTKDGIPVSKDFTLDIDRYRWKPTLEEYVIQNS